MLQMQTRSWIKRPITFIWILSLNEGNQQQQQQQQQQILYLPRVKYIITGNPVVYIMALNT